MIPKGVGFSVLFILLSGERVHSRKKATLQAVSPVFLQMYVYVARYVWIVECAAESEAGRKSQSSGSQEECNTWADGACMAATSGAGCAHKLCISRVQGQIHESVPICRKSVAQNHQHAMHVVMLLPMLSAAQDAAELKDVSLLTVAQAAHLIVRCGGSVAAM